MLSSSLLYIQTAIYNFAYNFTLESIMANGILLLCHLWEWYGQWIKQKIL